MTIQIETHHIEVRDAEQAITVEFSSGRKGECEAGRYTFWLIVLKERVDTSHGAGNFLIVRQREGYPIAERIYRFRDDGETAAGRAANRHVWDDLLQHGANIDHVRAATQRDVDRWLELSPRDAAFAVTEKASVN